MSRPTWAEIDLSAIRYNLRQIKKLTSKPQGVSPKIMVVVKANAYGHGLIEVARTLEKMDIHYLGVATLDEAALLRRQGIKLPILVLGLVLKEELDYALAHNIALTLCSADLARSLNNKAKACNRSVPVHIKIDTGMGRIGLWHEEAFDVLKKIAQMKHIKMEGIYTHFADASRDNAFTEYQLKSFENLLEELAARGIHFDYRHAANSIALVDLRRSHFNLVRPGIIVYGMYPKRSFSRKLKLKAALSLKTRIVYLKDVPAGRSLSYGRTFVTKKATRIATLPIGYADGYGRILSNRAFVLVRGQRAPVVGRVTMDQIMVDVGHIKDARIGDEVVLIGCKGNTHMRAEEIARVSRTIPYEIVCSITNRVPRVYKGM
ncbi:MAG: alanine racemase [Candidatus Omnitrophota bacterium]|nr:MAG: alanine racemase [Candidatus Omnitrophota bacterium]